jgi:uncharacterized glyoxalase superfamily metalloenzyme YdcJ
VALTHDGRALYDRLLASAQRAKKGADNCAYQALLSEIFKDFPDDESTLRKQGLAYFYYQVTDITAPDDIARDDLEALISAGCIRARPIIYEDFLPVSAAGIFRSNLGGDDNEQASGDARANELEDALGVPIIDELTLYESIENCSIRAALDAVRHAQAVD